MIIRGLLTTIPRCLGSSQTPRIEFGGSSGLIKLLLNKWKSIRLGLGVRVGFTLGTGFCCFPMLSGPSYFTELTFPSYLVMLILSFLDYLGPNLLPMIALVHPPSLLPMIMSKFKPPLGPFKGSKPPYELMLKPRTLPFMTLSKSDMMSFVRWSPPKISIFRASGLVFRRREIAISLNVTHRTLLPLLHSNWFLVLPLPFFSYVFALQTMLCTSMGELLYFGNEFA